MLFGSSAVPTETPIAVKMFLISSFHKSYAPLLFQRGILPLNGRIAWKASFSTRFCSSAGAVSLNKKKVRISQGHFRCNQQVCPVTASLRTFLRCTISCFLWLQLLPVQQAQLY